MSTTPATLTRLAATRLARPGRAKAARPSRSALSSGTAYGNERAVAQRARILDAAERCFIGSGFHAASMASIAATAGISAGLIYRYFDSKNAIVRAIIERHLQAEGCCRINQLDLSGDVCALVLEVFERWRRGDDPKMNAALMLELTAESTRDPQLAAIVREQDREIHKRLTEGVRTGVRARGIELSAAAARGRAVLLQCLVEGLASRAVRDPTLTRQLLRPALERVIAALMS